MKVKNIEWIVSDETEENSFRNDAEIYDVAILYN